MKLTSCISALFLLGVVGFLGCARPAALAPTPLKPVYVNLHSLLPLHPSYPPLEREEEMQRLVQAQSKPVSELVPTQAKVVFSQGMLGSLAGDRAAIALPPSVAECPAKDRAATLIGLKTVVQSRRQAGADLLEEEFVEKMRQSLLPLRSLAREAVEAQLDEIVGLEARLAAPDLRSELRTSTEEKLASLRRQRDALLQAQRRKTALELESFWASRKLDVERQLAEYDSRVRAGAEAAFASRSTQLATDSETLSQLLSEMNAPRPTIAAQQLTALTGQRQRSAPIPSPSAERQADRLARIGKGILAAVQQVAAQNFWQVSLVPLPGAEDVTDRVRDVLSKDFYPKS